MSRSLLLCAAALVIHTAPSAAAPRDGDMPAENEVVVIGTSPIIGPGIDRDKIPANTETVTGDDIRRAGSLLEALNGGIGGIGLGHAQGNPFQPNLVYRGFEASPLAGNAQGLAVYVEGGRFNQPFGDTVNWDLIPEQAIDAAVLQTSNPAFGLNALGGALSVGLKDGFSYRGAETELTGGSRGSIEGALQYGAQSGPFAAYLAVRGLHDKGWRDHSPSDLRQMFADLGWRGDRAEIHLGVLGADNTLIGNGTAPVDLLAASRKAVFTHPDETRNRFGRINLNASLRLSDAWSVQAGGYVGHLRQRTRNGDAADVEPCEDDEALLCLEDGDALTALGGGAIGNFITDSPYAGLPAFAERFEEGGPYAQLNRTATNTDSFGVSAQVTWQGKVGGMTNQFLAGLGYDGGRTRFSATSEIGALGLDRGFEGPGIVIVQPDGVIAPVSVHTSADYLGVFLRDTLDITNAVSLSVGGRYNHAAIDLVDQIGTALNGRHRYNRFNPQAGITWKLTPIITAYAGYAEANRAPTPAELSCADPEAPCSLTNFFVGDPPLEQVTTRTVEAGLRGRLQISPRYFVSGKLGLFTTTNRNDISFVASDIPGRAFFMNVGRTRRQGIEAAASLGYGALQASVDYAYMDATFRNPLVLNSPDNPFADNDGQIFVDRGDNLPGIPRHRLKARLDYDASDRLRLGLDARFSSGQFLFGDEANNAPKTSSYVVVGASASYRIGSHLELFLRAENLLNTKYETFGTFSPTDEVPIIQAPDADNPRSLSPGPPITMYFGIRVSL
ncbi:TonB-dependent receptor [Emcibacter sp. SYSU 3D8]|uniref:TonB-dependent receptor n=1 Tax=Emcibacter sp. SYSU 3D8 TaxID=3133969 RepID=UPI0031FE7A42